MARISLWVVLLILEASVLCAQPWGIVWSDEFNTEGVIDSEKWSFMTGGGGFGNNELQYYTDRAENARLESGRLIIEARNESFGGSNYTSARMVTKGKGDWRYGRIEVSAKLPYGQGIWPAIWMLPSENVYGGWPASGEIDIMEMVGNDPTNVYGTIHTDWYNHLDHTQKGKQFRVPDAQSAYHVYAIEWRPNRIDFFVDDTFYHTYLNDGGPYGSWPFDQDFHLILNLAVGGDWPGYPDGSTVFPQRIEVDYVRVYEDLNLPPTVSFTEPQNETTFNPGDSVHMAVEASDDFNQIREVRFLQDDGLLFTDTVPPYEFTVDNLYPGCYVLRAVAIDEGFRQSVAAKRTVRVGSECTQAPYLMRPTAIPGNLQTEYFDISGDFPAYADLTPTNNGFGIRRNEGVDIESSTDLGDGYHVTQISPREWIAYTVDIAQAGQYRATFRVASKDRPIYLRIELDGVDASGLIELPPTGGEYIWKSLVKDIFLESGIYEMRLVFGSSGFNLNYITFSYRGAVAVDEETVAEQSFRIQTYPNPAQNRVILKFDNPSTATYDVWVHDLLGRAVYRDVIPSFQQQTVNSQIDISGLPSGTYMITVDGAGSLSTHPLLVVR